MAVPKQSYPTIPRMLSLVELKEKAQLMRQAPTLCESRAQDSFPAGLVVERQVVFGYYILDFVVAEKLLVIEIDGDSHTSLSQRAHDAQRDKFCQKMGLTVLRIPNRLAHTTGAQLAAYPPVVQAAKRWAKAQRRAHFTHGVSEEKQGLPNAERDALRAGRATARAARQDTARRVLAALPADASGRQIVAAMRQKSGTLSANQQAAKDRAKQRRIAVGQANKIKHEAKVVKRRAVKEARRETRKQDVLQAKAAQFAAVVAATVW